MSWVYKKKTIKQLEDWYKNKVRERKSEFISISEFFDWYQNNPKICYYCGLSEVESQEIVHKGLLKSNRFPYKGEIKQGVNRGYWLEIDRKNPKGMYSKENCVLCCYFCNNDKSDVFNHEQYLEFVKDRPKFLKKLLGENR